MDFVGVIICQTCEKVIEHFEGEKVATLYAKCNSCQCEKEKAKN
ncbi:GapA-binding peptide SR1P [Anaerobacillus sp. MEB173]